MKRIIVLFVVLFSFNMFVIAQESAKPLTDTEVVRKVSIMDIEEKVFYDVKVTLKSVSPDYYFTSKYKVKVTIHDRWGNIIYKKTLKNVFLYVFSDGQVQVGKSNFDQVLIQKSSEDNSKFIGKTREKEGVF